MVINVVQLDELYAVPSKAIRLGIPEPEIECAVVAGQFAWPNRWSLSRAEAKL